MATVQTLGFPRDSSFATARVAFAINNRNTFLKNRHASFTLFSEAFRHESSLLKMDV